MTCSLIRLKFALKYLQNNSVAMVMPTDIPMEGNVPIPLENNLIGHRITTEHQLVNYNDKVILKIPLVDNVWTGNYLQGVAVPFPVEMIYVPSDC